MRYWLFTCVAAACSAAPAATPGATPPLGGASAPTAAPGNDARVVIMPSAENRVLGYAAVKTLTGARLVRGGTAMESKWTAPLAPEAALRLPVVEQTSTQVRVAVTGDDVYLLVWVDKTRLFHSITRRVRISQADNESGLVFMPGAVVTASDSIDGRKKITYEDFAFEAVAWAPPNAVGFLSATDIPDRPPAPDSSVASGTLLLWTPGGAAFGRFAQLLDGEALVLTHGPGRDGYVEVTYAGVGFTARGWIPESAVTASPTDVSDTRVQTVGPAMIYAEYRYKTRTPPATYLYAAPQSTDIVGITTAGLDLSTWEHETGWKRMHYMTPFGDIDLWLEP